jgi:hypothetical protein
MIYYLVAENGKNRPTRMFYGDEEEEMLIEARRISQLTKGYVVVMSGENRPVSKINYTPPQEEYNESLEGLIRQQIQISVKLGKLLDHKNK